MLQYSPVAALISIAVELTLIAVPKETSGSIYVLSKVEMSQGTARGKWTVLLTVLAIALPLIGPYQYDHMTGVADTFKNANEMASMQLHRAIEILWGTSIAELFCAYAAFAMFRLGRATVRGNRFPPPGYAMAFNSQIMEGRRAHIQGRTYQMIAILLQVCAFSVIGLALWNYHQVSAVAARLAQFV